MRDGGSCCLRRRAYRISTTDSIGVDAWLTEDQTHVVKIASNRTPAK